MIEFVLKTNTDLCMDVKTILHSDSITGTYHPNFRPLKMDADFNVAQFASDVANELLWALEGLVEEK